MTRFLFVLLLMLCCAAGISNGQNKPAPKAKPVATKPGKPVRYGMSDEKMEANPSVGIAAKAIQKRIYLRWAPTMQSYWEFGYRDGYVVERINVRTRQQVVLQNWIMPKPAASWKPFLDKKDRNYSLLYSSIFEAPNFSSDPITQINERRQLFHFSLFSADVNFQAACMAGLGMIDSTAVPGERYQYVISHKSAARYKLKSVISPEVGVDDITTLPGIPYFTGIVGGRVVTLITKTASIRSTYNQYQIERSEDSIHYKPITDLPIIVTNKLDTLSITDTLASDAITYHYRIRGLTLFQEIGPYSKSIRVKSKSTLPHPEIYSVKETDVKDSIEVQWLYKDSLNQYIDHYQIVGSQQHEGPFIPLSDAVPADQHITYIRPLAPVRGFTFFIKLLTFTKKGDRFETLAYPVTLADDDPPVQPQGLTGTIKVEGKQAFVSLSWKPNTDADLYGYFVYRSNGAPDGFRRVNNEFIQQTTLTDTIYLDQAKRYVSYTVKAMDFLFKQSVGSTVLTLKVPDIIPPTSPIIDSFAVADRKLFLRWMRSYSEDVEKHILYRKKLPAASWEEVMTITDTLTRTYTDSTVAEKSLYAYTLVAFDDSQNKSIPATPVVLETPYFSRTVDFSQFTSAVIDTTKQSIRLVWTCNESDKIDNFLIYRAVPDDELALVKKLDGTSREWMDYVEMLPNKPYRYVIRARMQEGYLSGWKETVIELKQ
ncbi:hypothetical protein GCM10028805_38770 [Spirosoma harenae]